MRTITFAFGCMLGSLVWSVQGDSSRSAITEVTNFATTSPRWPSSITTGPVTTGSDVVTGNATMQSPCPDDVWKKSFATISALQHQSDTTTTTCELGRREAMTRAVRQISLSLSTLTVTTGPNNASTTTAAAYLEARGEPWTPKWHKYKYYTPRGNKTPWRVLGEWPERQICCFDIYARMANTKNQKVFGKLESRDDGRVRVRFHDAGGPKFCLHDGHLFDQAGRGCHLEYEELLCDAHPPQGGWTISERKVPKGDVPDGTVSLGLGAQEEFWACTKRWYWFGTWYIRSYVANTEVCRSLWFDIEKVCRPLDLVQTLGGYPKPTAMAVSMVNRWRQTWDGRWASSRTAALHISKVPDWATEVERPPDILHPATGKETTTAAHNKTFAHSRIA
ncbi:hypothetical protein ANO11243_004980 [Dothideomycetidae sp. 11243]|nr:hypothetical protein ANO11243_004980 [fungal sp. No.11243]